MESSLTLLGFFAWLVAGFAVGIGWALANGLIALIGRGRAPAPPGAP